MREAGRQQRGRKPAQSVNPWQPVREFLDDATGVAVTVWRQHAFEPKWSIQVGMSLRGADGIRPYIPMRITPNGSVAVDVAEVILDLADQAQRYIETEVQKIAEPSSRRPDPIVIQKRRG